MADKFIKGYVQQKHDTFANWELSSLIPAAGQIIVYDDGSGGESIPKIKIGDGTTIVKNLPFSGSSVYLQEAEPTEASNGSFWAWTPPPPYIVTTVRPSGTEISAGISTLSAAKIKEIADAIATEATVDNNVETVYVWVIAENGYYTISIGDQISWTMNGTSYPYRIMGFNHYDKADGNGKAGILFQMVDCCNTTYPMKPSMTSADGWDDCDLRTTLNSTLYGYLPSDVQNAISQVMIKTAQDVSTSTIITTDDKLFVPAEVEVFGLTSYAKGGTNEGVWYPWYKANNSVANRVKKVNGSASGWWGRSPSSWNSTNSNSFFSCVNSGGHSTSGYADSSRGAAPCFCF